MRAQRQEPSVDRAFVSAIRETTLWQMADGDLRQPVWHVIRFITLREPLLRHLLSLTKLDYRIFKFLQRQPRARPIERAWLPGYAFVEFDAAMDLWHQLNDMPPIIAVLGGGSSPLEAGVMEDFEASLPYRLAKADADASIAPGKDVRVKVGPFAGHAGTVVNAKKAEIEVVMVVFGRPMKVWFKSCDVELV